MGIGFYGIAKLALNGITQSLARELGPWGIRVNAIAPGPTDTEATRSIVPAPYPEADARPDAARPRRHARRTSSARCLFLLSDASAWMTGQVINVDGGQIMRP